MPVIYVISLYNIKKSKVRTMKSLLRKIFAFILNPLETGDDPVAYKPSHRKILITMGLMFSALGGGVMYLAIGNDPGYFLPVIIFGGGGILSLIVGFLGSDRAVSRIWGTGKR